MVYKRQIIINEIYNIPPDELKQLIEQRQAVQSERLYRRGIIPQLIKNCWEILSKADPFSPREL